MSAAPKDMGGQQSVRVAAISGLLCRCLYLEAKWHKGGTGLGTEEGNKNITESWYHCVCE